MSTHTSAFTHGLRFLLAGAICFGIGKSDGSSMGKMLWPAGACMAIYGGVVLLLELLRVIFATFLAADLGKNQEKE